MARRKKVVRKTRITRQNVESARAEAKLTSYQRKKKIVPGPWTNTKVDFDVKAELILNDTTIMSSILGACRGIYKDSGDLWGEKGWYPVVFNLTCDNMADIIEKHGIDSFLAAAEKSLNEQKTLAGKPKYGVMVFLSAGNDGSKNTDSRKRFISIHAKSNKKNISAFQAIRKKQFVILP